MRSFITTALCLSLIHSSNAARVPHSFRDLIQQDAELEQSPSITDRLSTFFARLFKRNLETRQSNDDDDDDSTCYIDEYYNFVDDMRDGPAFCHAFIEYANVTTTVDYTPTR